MSLEQIYDLAEDLLNFYIRRELQAQGHYLTGATANSLEAKIVRDPTTVILYGYAAPHVQMLNYGVRRGKIDGTMYPGLVRYFQLRGLDEKNARIAAANTLRKQRKEGMPTKASYRFSRTGERLHFIERAFNKARIDGFMTSEIDKDIERQFLTLARELI